MSLTRTLALVTAVSACALSAARADLKPMRLESPPASVSLDLGITHIQIDYHRPSVRGRIIWGGLVPYGQVWRTGANNATTLSFDNPIKIAGTLVPAGKYAFFAIPDQAEWTLIISKQADIWGAYEYKQSEDVMRVKVKPETATTPEALVYLLTPTSEQSAKMTLEWAGLRVAMDLDVDVHGIYKTRLLEAVGKANKMSPESWSVFQQAAQYYFKRDMELDQALAWANESIRIKESFWNYELKARILEKTGKRADAIAAMKKAIELAKAKPLGQGGPPKEYTEALEKDLAAWQQKR